MLKGGTQKTRKSAFDAKREAALIDGWAHIGCQGRKMSEKSNSAFELEDKPIPARESFVAFRWMSFILPLAALSISKLFLHWLLDQSHTLTTQNCKHIYRERRLLFSDHELTSSVFYPIHKLSNERQQFAGWLLKRRVEGSLVLVLSNAATSGVTFALHSVVFCGQLEIDLQ